MEEELSQACNSLIRVHNTDGKLTDLTLHLHHVVENQVGQHLKGSLAHKWGCVAQSGWVTWM